MTYLDGITHARREDALGVSVAVLEWPREAERAAELARMGAPRLLLVAPEAAPPVDCDGLTDWTRLPVADEDLFIRVATTLQRRSEQPPAPTLDEFDVLWRGARWTALAPVEARLLAALLARTGTVLSRRELGSAVWPDGMPSERAIDTRLQRLRQRIEPLGLRIHSVRRRGLLLEVEDPPLPSRAPAGPTPRRAG